MFQQKKQEELQKKLLEDEEEPQTLQQQENMSIKGQSARHLVMQKLMRKVEVRINFRVPVGACLKPRLMNVLLNFAE